MLFYKLLATIAAICMLAVTLIIAVIPNATGYEMSIYHAYPLYFWLLLLASLICGILILTYQAFTKSKSSWWISGLIIMITTNLIIILLPGFRDYFISDYADELDHLGLIKDIAMTGYIGGSNIYPISHIIAYNISSVCALDIKLVLKIIPAIFYIIYIFGLLLLTKEMGGKFRQSLLVLSFSSVLLFTYFNYLFLPTQFFVELVPLIIFLFIRSQNCPNIYYGIIFIILLLPMPFLHPLGSTFLVLIFIILMVSIIILKFVNKRSVLEYKIVSFNYRSAIPPALIVLIVFFMWFTNFALFNYSIDKAFNWFVYGYGTTAMQGMVQDWETVNMTITQFLNLLFNSYGQCLIFSLLSLIAIIFLIGRILFSKKPINLNEIFLSLTFVVFSLFYISTLVTGFLGTGKSIRIFIWALMASTLLNGIVFYELLSKFKGKLAIFFKSNLVLIIIIAAIIGIFNVYPSPITKQAGIQVTYMDWSAIEWFFNKKNSDPTIYFDQLPFRAPGYIYGYDADKPESLGDFSVVPQHIGYDKNETLKYAFNLNSYTLINKRIRLMKAYFWPEHGRYTLEELNKIELDLGVSKIYSNPEMEIYYIIVSKP